MPSTRGKKVVPVGDSLLGLLSHLGYQKRSSALWGMVVWNDAVGDAVARHAQPERVEGSVLWVVVDSAAWAEELRWMEASLVARINAASGRSAVAGLRMRVGRLAAVRRANTSASASQDLRPAETAASAKAVLEPYRREAETMLPENLDPELAQAFAGFVTQGLARLGGRCVGASQREPSGTKTNDRPQGKTRRREADEP